MKRAVLPDGARGNRSPKAFLAATEVAASPLIWMLDTDRWAAGLHQPRTVTKISTTGSNGIRYFRTISSPSLSRLSCTSTPPLQWVELLESGLVLWGNFHVGNDDERHYPSFNDLDHDDNPEGCSWGGSLSLFRLLRDEKAGVQPHLARAVSLLIDPVGSLTLPLWNTGPRRSERRPVHVL